MWAVVLRDDGVYEVGVADTLRAKMLGKKHDLIAVCPEKYQAVALAGCFALILVGQLDLCDFQKELIKEGTEIEDGLNGI